MKKIYKNKKLALFLVVLFSFIVGISVYYSNTPKRISLKSPFNNDKDLDTFVVDIYEQGFQTNCNYVPKPGVEAPYQQIIGYKNNKYGMYAYDIESLIYKSAEFANSNGGDWGYILIPINISENDEGKLNKVFAQLNQLHLIPIFQLWDYKPEKLEEDTTQLANLLNNMPWPIQNRYISVYNEVNDNSFWKGKRNPAEYADVLEETIDIFKQTNPNYFLMNGAFNTSARSNPSYTSTEVFLQQMNQHNPRVLKKLDGWASHPYPQPNFSASPLKQGRDGVQAYKWELNKLQQLGVPTANLPVFITETGWAHREGVNPNYSYITEEKAAKNLEITFKRIWLPDNQVVAVTPFTIIYDAPYDHFSFLKKDGTSYKTFDIIKNTNKAKGAPTLTNEHFSQIQGLPTCQLF